MWQLFTSSPIFFCLSCHPHEMQKLRTPASSARRYHADLHFGIAALDLGQRIDSRYVQQTHLSYFTRERDSELAFSFCGILILRDYVVGINFQLKHKHDASSPPLGNCTMFLFLLSSSKFIIFHYYSFWEGVRLY